MSSAPYQAATHCVPRFVNLREADSMAPPPSSSRLDMKRPGFFGRLTFNWINAIVHEARGGQLLNTEHLPLPPEQHADANFDVFQKQWEKELEKDQTSTDSPSLFRALWRLYGRELMIGGMFKLMWSVLLIMGAFFFVRSLLQYVDTKEVSPYDSDLAGWILVAFFFLDAWLLGLSLQRMADFCLRVGIKTRAALVSAVAKKALSMESAKNELSAEVVNFVASDIHKIYDGIQQVHYLWTAPLEALTILALLTFLTHTYALPAYVIVFAVVVLQYFFGYIIAKLKYKNIHNVGARVALAQEVLPAMKLVKYYCWETFFASELIAIRDCEQKTLWNLLLTRTMAIAMVFSTPPIITCVIFTSYEFAVGQLSAEISFTVLSLDNIMRFPLVVLPKAIRSASEGWTSLKRVEAFLLLPVEHKEAAVSSSPSVGITINNGVFGYKEAKDDFTLRIPEFEVKPGEVVGIAGLVGSGKTSVINAIMGYMETKAGSCTVNGTFGYVRQVPWVQNIAIRDNILFGERFDQKKYDATVHACALELDFQILAKGDQTKAGLRGINLSGGQRHRISIARAAYSDAQIMLIDNPLSAVDYHTAHHIFKHCIKNLFSKKAVVLVTHSLDLLPQCDKIAIMDGGKMVYFGPFSMTAINWHMPSPINNLLEEAAKKAQPPVADEDTPPRRLFDKPPPKDESRMSNIVIPGEAASGATGYRIPMYESMGNFWIEGGLLLGIVSLVLYILAQSSRQMSDYWVSKWVEDSLHLYSSSNSDTSVSLTYSMVYMALAVAFSIFNWVRGFAYFAWTRNAANNFFCKYVNSTFEAPLAFFFNNPVGDLINIYTKDQHIMDENLPEALHFTGIYGLILLATVVTVSIVIPYFGVFAGVLIIVSLLLLYLYLPLATQLKTLTSDRNGALAGIVSEALEGLDVIQAYKKQNYFIAESEHHLNAFHRCFFNLESLNLWLAFYCDFFGAILVLAVAVFAVAQKSELGPAKVGLAFSNVIQMLVFYTWVIRFLGDTISFWSSAERISGLALNTPKEADLSPPETNKGAVTDVNPDLWKPSRGQVRFDNVWMRYKYNLPWVLKGVSFELQPQEKIGVIGRTGSGKSTLLLALYRMFELGAGHIIYDGVDIADLPRDKLRRSLSVIPQEPLMFSGTLRSNLDPYDEYPDAELWTALEQTGLKDQAESMKGGLDAYVDGTTTEWSLGQKQLLCLARAALTKVPVLCLDEATAAMDPQTEQLVLQTIDVLFASRTIVTIAHRLDVVIKSDRILFLDQGEILELDTPDNLLSRPESMFSMLVNRSQPTLAAALRHMAREVAVRKGHRAH